MQETLKKTISQGLISYKGIGIQISVPFIGQPMDGYDRSTLNSLCLILAY
nr:MAG TPA: hypothetical protein [Caudoviricetes sp.]